MFNETTGELIPSDKYLYSWFNVTYYEADTNANDTEVNDTVFPMITGSSPIGDFATGTFEVGFIEENPKELSLIYENGTELRGESVDLNSCLKEGNETYCVVNSNLSEFDGQEITYYFHLEDIAGNYDDSRKVKVNAEDGIFYIQYNRA